MAKGKSGGRKIEITPTLVVGLGGTGMRVLSLFKQKIELLCGSEAPVGFFGIDTDDERLPGAQLSPSEFALCECPLADDVIRAAESGQGYEDIQRWWIPGMKPGKIQKGAKMKRAVGRLACYYNFPDKIEIPLRRQIRNLTRQYSPEEEARWPFRVRHKTIRVYVVGSLCGGTGGGFFFDMAVAVRHAIQDVAGVDLKVCLAGILVLPRGFVDVVPMEFQRSKVRANFYAGLREIEFLHRSYEKFSDPESDLAINIGGTPMRLRVPPFDWVYLVDTINEASQNISMPQLWSMIASNLCLEVYSSVTNNVQESILANVTPDTVYASFSVASLRVPVNEILEYCALRCAREVLEERICHSRPETTELDEIAKFMTDNTLFQGSEQVLSAFLLDSCKRGRKTAVQSDISRQSAGKALLLANREKQALESEKKGIPAVHDGLSKATGKKADAVEAEARKKIKEMLADQSGTYGIEFMIRFCRHLEKTCIAIFNSLDKQASEIDTNALQKQVEAAYLDLQQTLKDQGSWIVKICDRGRSAQRCYESWAAAMNRGTSESLRKAALIQAGKVFQRLQEVATRSKESLKKMAAQVDGVAKECMEEAEGIRRELDPEEKPSVLVTNVISGDEVPRIYDKIRKDVDLGQFVSLIKADRSIDWVNVRIDDMGGTLERELLPAIRDVFLPHMEKLDVFSAVEEYGTTTVQRWVKEALAQSSPFCNWNPVRGKRDVFSMTIVGVADEGRHKSYLGDIGEGKTCKVASTGDSYEIVIHSLTAGYPASSVSGLGQDQDDRFHYERWIQKAKADPGEHVHVDKRWLNPDGTPWIPDIE
ncbi:MAG: hypothetical protein GXP25_02895 [Planctomycetes bacterium]|nr:hypothetical protein [Planctomycetota bacterium]